MSVGGEKKNSTQEQDNKRSRRRFLQNLTLAFASLLGGLVTLVGTPPNILV